MYCTLTNNAFVHFLYIMYLHTQVYRKNVCFHQHEHFFSCARTQNQLTTDSSSRNDNVTADPASERIYEPERQM